MKVTWDPGLEILPAISPDGKSVAYSSGSTINNMRIYVRPVAGGRSIQLTDDTSGVQGHPRWSPDGTRILFLAGGGVFSAPAAGGPARPELPPGRPSPIISAAYAPDGKTIAYVIEDSLFLRGEDGTSRPLRRIVEASACTWSPNGELIACGSGNALALTVGNAFGNISPSGIVVCRVSDGSLIPVSDSLSLNQGPVWSPDGRRLYYISNRHGPRDVYAQRLSGAGQPTGDPVRLTTGLDAHTISLSQDGRRLAYASLTTESNIWSLALTAPFPVSGAAAVKVTTGTQSTESASISSDGKWLFYDSDLGGNMDLYRMSLATGIPERLTTDPSDDFAPEPSPNGREVAFHSWRGRGSRDIYVLPLDGGPVQRVTNTPLQEALATWSPDGNALAFIEFTTTGGIWIARRTNGMWGAPVRRLDHGFWPNWSPDGRQLSFAGSILGGALGVVPVDSGPPRILLDGTHGLDADKAYWSADGTTLVFHGHDARGRAAMFSIPAAGGTPRLLAVFEDPNVSAVRGGWGFAHGRTILQRGRTAERRVGDGAGAAVSGTMERLAAALADRYRIERELGAGGMATVYLAARPQARPQGRDQGAAPRAGRRHRRRAVPRRDQDHRQPAASAHPRRCSTRARSNGTVFYVMPFVEGESLRDRLDPREAAADRRRGADRHRGRRRARLRAPPRRDPPRHQAREHPAARRPARWSPISASRSPRSRGRRPRMTETGMSLGTPQYMSPEQAMGEREINARTDVYALGCVLYEMLTGEPPFTGPTAQAIVAKVMTAEPAPATTLRKTVPPHVADAVHTALEKLPADRFASAADFAAALDNPAFGTATTQRVTAAGRRAAAGRGLWPWCCPGHWSPCWR